MAVKKGMKSAGDGAGSKKMGGFGKKPAPPFKAAAKGKPKDMGMEMDQPMFKRGGKVKGC